MGKVRCCVVAIALSLLLPVPAPAEVQCGLGVKFRPLDVFPVTLYFRDTYLSTVFSTIQALTGTPFRVPAELGYRVSFDIRKVPACRVLEIIGESQSLTYRQEGDTIVVIPPEPQTPPVIPSPAPKPR